VQNEKIIIKGEDKTKNILEWSKNGDKIEITFTNKKTYSYNIDNVQIIRSTLTCDDAAKRFNYLKRIAETVGLRNDDGVNILSTHYEKINFISNECILSALLTGKLPYTKKICGTPIQVLAQWQKPTLHYCLTLP